MNDLFVGMRKARILIPGNTPLSLLAMVGPEALDWLFVPGAEVWVTDMVRREALRDPPEGGDQRELHRRDIINWFERNKHLIHEQPTDEGEEYRKAMEAWRLAGMPKELKPSWKGRGERSVLEVLEQDLGKPVISSASAMMWHALRLTGVGQPIAGYGGLLTLR